RHAVPVPQPLADVPDVGVVDDGVVRDDDAMTQEQAEAQQPQGQEPNRDDIAQPADQPAEGRGHGPGVSHRRPLQPWRGRLATAALGVAVEIGDAWLRGQTRERLLLDLLTGALLVGAGVALAAAMGRTALVVGLCVAVASLAIGSWIGANSPTESWFGAMVAHGPRREDR